MFFIFELLMLHIFNWLIKDHVQMVASVDFCEIFLFISFFNASNAVIFLFSSSSDNNSGSSWDWLTPLAASRTWFAKLELNTFQINSVYKSSRSCRGDWKESQSWFWIWTRNTSKLFFLWRCKSYNMDENSLEKLDNELQVKKCVKQKYPCVFYFPNQS